MMNDYMRGGEVAGAGMGDPEKPQMEREAQREPAREAGVCVCKMVQLLWVRWFLKI